MRRSTGLQSWLTALTVMPLILAACSSPASAPTQAPTTAAAKPTTASAAQATTAPAAAAAQPTSAPAAASGEKVELRFTWWGSQDRHDRTIKAIELFQRMHPNITITYEFANFNDYWTKMGTYATGKNLPDLMQQDYAYITEWAGNNLIVPLDDFVNDKTINVGDVPKASLDGGRINGKLIAVNLGNNSQTVVLDVDAFQKANIELPQPTWSWDDMEKIATDLHSKLGIYGVGAALADNQMWKSLYLGYGKWAFTPDGKALGYDNDQPIVDYLKMVGRLQEAGIAPGQQDEIATYRDGSIEARPIVTGKAGMEWVWSNQLVAMWKAAGDNRHFKLTMLPRPKDGGKAENYLKPSQFISLTRDSKHPKEAAMFIDFITNDVEANKILLGERGVPISTKIQEAIKPLLTPAQIETQDYVSFVEKNGSPLPPPDPAALQKLVNNLYNPQFVDAVLLKQTTPENAAAQFRKDATALLTSS